MHHHRLLNTEGKVYLVNTFHRALNVGDGNWIGAPQVISFAHGTPFTGLVGRREEDLTGAVRVFIVGPAVDDGRAYLRVVRVLEDLVFDNPCPLPEGRDFGKQLDAYAASDFSESAWLLANESLKRWSNGIFESIVNTPELLRHSEHSQRWMEGVSAALLVGHAQSRVGYRVAV